MIARKFVIPLFLTLISGSVLAQQAKNTTVEFDKFTHDFGKIEEAGSDVSYTFTFRNAGKDPFVIYSIGVTCGCTTPEWDKSPVMPGKTGTIKVTFDPYGRPGRFDKPINLMCNVEGGNIKLSLTGLVNPRVRTIIDDYPFQIADGLRVAYRVVELGAIPRGEVSFSTLGIANNSEKPITVDIDRSLLSSYVTVNPAKTTLAPKERSDISVKFDATKLDRWGDTEFYYSFIVNGVKQDASVVTKAVLVENFSKLTKDQLRDAPISEYSSYFYHFSENPKGAKLEREFYVSNSGKNDLIIRNVSYNEQKLKVTCDQKVIKEGQTATIKVVLKNTDKEGRIAETVKIITNDPQMPVREIRVLATIK